MANDDLQEFCGTEVPDGLRYKAIPLATDPEDGSPLPGTARTLLCYNEAKAQEDRAFREVALVEAEAALRDLQQRLATQDRRRGRNLYFAPLTLPLFNFTFPD